MRVIGDLQKPDVQIEGVVFTSVSFSTLLTAAYGNTNLDEFLYTVQLHRGPLRNGESLERSESFFANAKVQGEALMGQFAVGPGGVLFAAFSPTQVMQMKPGQTNWSKRIDFPIDPYIETSGLNFVPNGFPGAGHMKIVSWSSGEWWDATVAPDGVGTYDVVSVTNTIQLPAGLHGFAYVAGGNPLITNSSVLVCYGNPMSFGGIDIYEIDSTGDPIASTRRNFITNFWSATGAAIDPITGEYFFCSGDSTMTNRLIAVSGFNPLHQISGAMSNQQFQGSYRGLWGTNYILEATSNLSAQSSWLPVQTNTATFNPITFTDAITNNSPRRFYRVRQGP